MDVHANCCKLLHDRGNCSLHFTIHDQKARHWSIIARFAYPICIQRPRYGGPRQNIGIRFGKQKLQELSYRKQIARQLRTQYVEGIYTSNYP